MQKIYIDHNGGKVYADLDRCECCAERTLEDVHLALYRTPGGMWFVSKASTSPANDEGEKYRTLDAQAAAAFMLEGYKTLPPDLEAAAGIRDLDEDADWGEPPPPRCSDANRGRFGWFVVRQSFTDGFGVADDGAVMEAADEAEAVAVAEAMTRREGTPPAYAEELGYACWYEAEAGVSEGRAMTRRLEILECEEAPADTDARRDWEACREHAARLARLRGMTPQARAAGPDAEANRPAVGAGVSAEDAEAEAERIVRADGGKWPGNNAMARRIGCGKSTIGKVLESSTYLAARRAEHDAAKPTGGRTVPMTRPPADPNAADPADAAAEAEIAKLAAEQAADERRDERQHRAAAKRPHDAAA